MTNFHALRKALLALLLLPILVACSEPGPPSHDLIIRGGTVYDGSGGEPFLADVAISDDRIAAVGNLRAATAADEIDATGLAVSPGFINMLSWAVESLIEDGRGQSDIRQGVTLEVFGEGSSMGPWDEKMKAYSKERQSDIKYDIEWTTLGEYLEFLETRGVSPNVASFVGATTVRAHEIGEDHRPASAEELERMKELVRVAMTEGAMGVGSSLIYAPGFFANTDELTALVGAAAEYGGMYISHVRNEDAGLLEAIDELIEISRRTGAPAEVYHFKVGGEANWHLLDAAIARIEAARAEGLPITADMYTYVAGGSGLDASMPLWVQDGGLDAWVERLKDPEMRRQVVADTMAPPKNNESNFYTLAGPSNIVLAGFRTEALRPLIGKTIAEVAEMRGTPPIETMMDLVVEDHSRVDVLYFLMSEENVAKKTALPWMSFGSDAGALAPEGNFIKSKAHPRAYGTFARFLGKYVRDQGTTDLADAIRRLSHLPASNLKLRNRGLLREGYFADVVVFDPATIQDHATFEVPHQYSTGVLHVLVNGVPVLANGEHTGATPGRVVRGPGWTGWDTL